MEKEALDRLISRLERKAVEKRATYLASVIAVALLGFSIIGVAIGFSLLALIALVAIGALVIFSGGKALFFLAKLGKLVIILALPAWTMVKTSLNMLFTRLPKPAGREITRSEASAMFARLDELQKRIKGPSVHKVLLTNELNAALVQHPRFGLLGWEQNYLILGLPLLLVLREEEALAVVAHEYGHLSGHHSRLGGFIYRFRAAWGRVQSMAEEWDDWGSRIIARLFRWYAPYFNAYTFVLARQQEYHADLTSVEVTGLHHTANALMRTDVIAGFENEIFWPAVESQVASNPEPPASRTSFWLDTIHSRLDEAASSRLLQSACLRKTDNLDTHPSLGDRLTAIGVLLDKEGQTLPEAQQITAATKWLGGSLQKIQREFDEAWRETIADKWHERHAYLRERQERLNHLEGLKTPDSGEDWERICLLGELRPDTELLPLVNALLAKAPDHLGARYRKGVLLLEEGDETGIADLEEVMKTDTEATLACCEAAWRFYEPRDSEKAGKYLKRWQERAEHARRVEEELKTLPADATLAPAKLDDAATECLRQILRRRGKYIRRAYIARRVLKSDPTVHDYVLAFETGLLTIGDKGPVVVKSLLHEEFPVRMFLVHLGSTRYKFFRKSIRKLDIEPLNW